MQRRSRIFVVLSGVVWVCCCGFDASAQKTSTDFYALTLIAADLDDASRTLALRDLNDDGVLDQQEWKALDWADEPQEIDVDENGILTLRELTNAFAGRQSHLRGEHSKVDASDYDDFGG